MLYIQKIEIKISLKLFRRKIRSFQKAKTFKGAPEVATLWHLCHKVRKFFDIEYIRKSKAIKNLI